MTAKQTAVKKYVVKLSDEERERLNTLIHKGKHRARSAGEGAHPAEGRCLARPAKDGVTARSPLPWIPAVNTVARTRQQLVEEGFEAVLTRKHSPASARPRIFDGAAEAKLIALACSEPPKGRVRWTLTAAGNGGRGAEHR